MVRCSLATLAKKLDGRISPGTAGRLLRKLGFSSRVNVKRFTGPPHPDRDKQFRHIARRRKTFQRANMPTISVDTKKKELIGDFRNAGRKWDDQPEQVNAHDFPQDAECRAVPYGIYDTSRNEGQCVRGHLGRYAAIRRACHSAMVAKQRRETLPERERHSDRSRRRWKQRLPAATVENGTPTLGQRRRPGHHGMPLPEWRLEVESDRAPTVQSDQPQLGGPSAFAVWTLCSVSSVASQQTAA